MKTYTVTTKRNANGSTFAGAMFKDAIVEYEFSDADTETYTVTTERDLETFFYTQADVISYSVL
jgi:hypothetical protein